MGRFTEQVVDGYRAKALLFTAERGLKGGHAKPIYWDNGIASSVNEKKLGDMLLDPEKIAGYCKGSLPSDIVFDFANELETSPEDAAGVYSVQEMIAECIGKRYFADFVLGYIAKQMKKMKGDIRGVIPENATDVYAIQIAEQEMTGEKGYDNKEKPDWMQGYSNLVHMRITQSGNDSSLSLISVPSHPFPQKPGRVDISRIGYGQSRSSHKDFLKQSLAAFARSTHPVALANLSRAKSILQSEEFTLFERDMSHSAEILGLD